MVWRELDQYKERHFRRIKQALLCIIIILIPLSKIVPGINTILFDVGGLDVLILFMVMEGVYYLIRVKDDIEQTERMKVFETQSLASKDIDDYIKKNKPKKACLIEYSSTTAQPILANLKDVGCEIQLLIAHPNSAVSDFQEQRILARIDSLIGVEFAGYKKIKIKCYENYQNHGELIDFFPSIWGRKFDDRYICLGWYTPSKTTHGGIVGHSNPIICGINDKNGQILMDHFDTVFDMLWKESKPIDEVYNEYKEKRKKHPST